VLKKKTALRKADAINRADAGGIPKGKRKAEKNRNTKNYNREGGANYKFS
jgi:hypothetical protein